MQTKGDLIRLTSVLYSIVQHLGPIYRTVPDPDNYYEEVNPLALPTVQFSLHRKQRSWDQLVFRLSLHDQVLCFNSEHGHVFKVLDLADPDSIQQLEQLTRGALAAAAAAVSEL